MEKLVQITTVIPGSSAQPSQPPNVNIVSTAHTVTQQAVEFVQRVERIVLIDGARLTELMIEHGVGVGHRGVKVPQVDGDYFVEQTRHWYVTSCGV